MKKGKLKNIIGWALSAAPVGALLFSGVKKLMNDAELVEKLPYIESLPILGFVSLTCVALYLIPKTSNIGFFLMCCYFGGVIVGELVMGEFPLIGIIMTTLLFVGTMLRKPELSGLGV